MPARSRSARCWKRCALPPAVRHCTWTCNAASICPPPSRPSISRSRPMPPCQPTPCCPIYACAARNGARSATVRSPATNAPRCRQRCSRIIESFGWSRRGMPALRCAGHFVLLASAPPADAEDYLAAGRALQRFWLTATRLGLQLQPEMTPLIFAEYVRNDLRFITYVPGWLSAKRVSAQLTRLLGPETCARAMFMGRIGAGPAPQARSVRLPLEELLIKP